MGPSSKAKILQPKENQFNQCEQITMFADLESSQEREEYLQ